MNTTSVPSHGNDWQVITEMADQSWTVRQLLQWHQRQVIFLEDNPIPYLDFNKTLEHFNELFSKQAKQLSDQTFFKKAKTVLNKFESFLSLKNDESVICLRKQIFQHHVAAFNLNDSLSFEKTLYFFSEALKAHDAEAVSIAIKKLSRLEPPYSLTCRIFLENSLKSVERYLKRLVSLKDAQSFNELFDFISRFSLELTKDNFPYKNLLTMPLSFFNPFYETQERWEKILNGKDYCIVENQGFFRERFSFLYIKVEGQIYKWVIQFDHLNQDQHKMMKRLDYARQIHSAKSLTPPGLFYLSPSTEQLHHILKKTPKLTSNLYHKDQLKQKFQLLSIDDPLCFQSIHIKNRGSVVRYGMHRVQFHYHNPLYFLLDYMALKEDALSDFICFAIRKNRPKLLIKTLTKDPAFIEKLNQNPQSDLLSFSIVQGKIEISYLLLKLGLRADKKIEKHQAPLFALLELIGRFFPTMRKQKCVVFFTVNEEATKKNLLPYERFLNALCRSLKLDLDLQKDSAIVEEDTFYSSRRLLADFAKKVAKVQLALDPSSAYELLIKTYAFIPDFAYTLLKSNPGLIQNLDQDYVHDLINASLYAGYWKTAIGLNKLNLNPRDRFSFQLFFKSLKKREKEAPYSEEQKKKILEFAACFLESGIDPNQRFNTHTTGEIDYFPLEYCYYESLKNSSIPFLELALVLLKHQAKITDRMAIHLKYHLKKEKVSPFAPYLIEQNLLTSLELNDLTKDEDLITDPIEKLSFQLNTGIVFMERELKIHHLNPYLVAYDKVSELRTLKKKVKGTLKENFNASLASIYQKFCRTYSSFILKHPFLYSLRKISQEIRRWANQHFDQVEISSLATTFYAYWGFEQSYSHESVKHNLFNITKINRKDLWNDVFHKALFAAQLVQHHHYPLMITPIVFLHGTRSSSLPSILQTNALIPAGMLLENNEGIPLSGELCGSDGHFNHSHLSGEAFSRNFKDIKSLFDAQTRFLVNILYGSKLEGYCPHEHYFQPEFAWKRMHVPYLRHLLDKPYNSWNSPWSIVKLDILRLRLTDSKANEKLSPVREFIEEELIKKPQDQLLILLRNHLTRPLPFQLKPEDFETFIKDSFPLVFGATNAQTNYIMNEVIVEGKLFLGNSKDIPFVFSQPHKLDLLQEHLQHLEIKAFDFNAGFFLEALNMIRGEHAQAINDFSLSRKISAYLQHDLLPLYATPFPKAPTYVEPKSGQVVKLKTPFYHPEFKDYETYQEAIEYQRILPRNTHGAMHAARTTLWTEILLTLYEKEGIDVAKINPLLLALAGACHDIARQDDGVDRWDEASAKFLKGYLQNLGFAHQEIAMYVLAVAEKDPAKGLYQNVAQKIIHDADVLEINRCIAPHEFKKEYLCFYSFPKLSNEKKNWIIEEAQAFIQLTEASEIKNLWEWESQDYYLDLVSLLKSKKQEFPFLNQLLNQDA